MGSAHLWLAFLLGVPQVLSPEDLVFKMGSAHPYLTMSGYPLNVPVLKYWYLVPLTKVLWAAGLLLCSQNM